MSYQPAQQFFYQKRIHVIQHMHTAKRRSCCRRSFKDSENHPQIPPTNHMYRTIAGGRPGTQMGAFGSSLTSNEVWHIVTFLREEARRAKAQAAKQDDDDHIW